MHLEVQVGSGGVAGGADPADDLSGCDPLALGDGEGSGVAVRGGDSAVVQQFDGPAFSALDLDNYRIE